MSIPATNASKPREVIPAGNYPATCYQMIEIGTITETIMGKNQTHSKVRIGWELPTENRVFDEAKGPQPMVISQEYTLSMNEKSNLRKMLAAWRGKDFTDEESKNFDVSKLIGKPCMINIIHKVKKDGSGVYAQISSVTPPPKGMQKFKQINDTFLLSYDEFDEELFRKLPDFITNVMKTSVEYKELMEPNKIQVKGFEPIDDDVENGDLPF
jgi:hypothetical protein